jgi:release factor glutamine methyltransferase
VTTPSAPPQTWTIALVLKWATDDFRAKRIESPRLDAEVLLAHALDTTRVQLIVDAMRPLEPTELARFRGLVRRRRAREPVAYILGRREFYGRVFRVDPRVLIPRPDTETLVSVGLEQTRGFSMSARVLDLCTGSGCVGVTFARERATTRVHVTDASSGALEVAKDNALRLGAYNVSFGLGDLYAAVPPGMRFDLVTANPPYIPAAEVPGLMPDIKDFEPHLALAGGADGLGVVRRIVQDAPSVLAPQGVLAFEVGEGQAAAAMELLTKRGFGAVAVAKDLARIDRVVFARWPASR